MNKRNIIVIGGVIIIIILIWVFMSSKKTATSLPLPGVQTASSTPATLSPTEFDARNATFEIDGEKITLKDGEHDSTTPPIVTTKYVGNEVTGDINGDDRQDKAFIIAQYGGGTGVFFSVLAALGTKDGYQTTNALFIGDRITPQRIVIKPLTLQVDYLDRNADEPFADEPTVLSTKVFTVTELGKLETKTE